jgi:NADH:ubiquinone oxidoreductase subunit
MAEQIVNSKDEIVSQIDHPVLHRYIINAISREFANMVEPCYYPDISKNSKLYKDLLHMTKSRESRLVQYAKEKFTPRTIGNKSKSKFLYDPYTILLVLIIQSFLHNKDIAGAEATFHLFSLKYYTSLLYRGTTPKGSHTKICNDNYFQTALDRLSQNHMFAKQKTIPNSIMYYSRATMKKYLKPLYDDDTLQIAIMIVELRTKLAQSMRSFFKQYYSARDNKDQLSRTKQEMDYDRSHEEKLKMFISRITKDICVYAKVDNDAVRNASSLIKFNKKLSLSYAQTLARPAYVNNIDIALFLILRDVSDVSGVQKMEFIDHVQKLMSIKVTKKKVYFKKTITEIHNQIIDDLSLNEWYDNLSIQSQSISRNFIAYYLAFYIRRYL